MNKEKKIVLAVLIGIWGLLSALHLGYGLHASAISPYHYTITGGDGLAGYLLGWTFPFSLLGGAFFGWIVLCVVKSRKSRILFAIVPFVVHMLCCVGISIPFTVHYFSNVAFDRVIGACLFSFTYFTSFFVPWFYRFLFGRLEKLIDKIKSEGTRELLLFLATLFALALALLFIIACLLLLIWIENMLLRLILY